MPSAETLGEFSLAIAGEQTGTRRRDLIKAVTACENSRTLHSFDSHIAWEFDVWLAEDLDYMIHFNGERFFTPSSDMMPTVTMTTPVEDLEAVVSANLQRATRRLSILPKALIGDILREDHRK